MRRNFTYDITTVTTRNELDDTLTEKKSVIEISGSLKEEIFAEALKTKSSNAKDNSGFRWSILGTILGAFIWWPIAAIEGVFTIAFAISKQAGKEFKNYVIMTYPNPGNERYILVTKTFDPEYDTINGLNDIAYYDGICSSCKKPIKGYKKMVKNNDNPYVCPNCGKTLFLKIDPKKVKTK